MNNYRYFLAVLFLISQLTGCGNLKENKYDENTPLAAFILGKWRYSQQTTSVLGTYHEEYFVKFGNRGKMMFCHKDPYDTSCSRFAYAYITGNQFSLESKRALRGEWQLKRRGENLEICFLSDIGECYEFTRDTSRYNLFLELLGMY